MLSAVKFEINLSSMISFKFQVVLALWPCHTCIYRMTCGYIHHVLYYLDINDCWALYLLFVIKVTQLGHFEFLWRTFTTGHTGVHAKLLINLIVVLKQGLCAVQVFLQSLVVIFHIEREHE